MRDKKDNRPSIITGKYNKENTLLSTTGLLNVVERLCSRGDQVAMVKIRAFIFTILFRNLPPNSFSKHHTQYQPPPLDPIFDQLIGCPQAHRVSFQS